MTLCGYFTLTDHQVRNAKSQLLCALIDKQPNYLDSGYSKL